MTAAVKLIDVKVVGDGEGVIYVTAAAGIMACFSGECSEFSALLTKKTSMAMLRERKQMPRSKIWVFSVCKVDCMLYLLSDSTARVAFGPGHLTLIRSSSPEGC